MKRTITLEINGIETDVDVTTELIAMSFGWKNIDDAVQVLEDLDAYGFIDLLDLIDDSFKDWLKENYHLVDEE